VCSGLHYPFPIVEPTSLPREARKSLGLGAGSFGLWRSTGRCDSEEHGSPPLCLAQRVGVNGGRRVGGWKHHNQHWGLNLG